MDRKTILAVLAGAAAVGLAWLLSWAVAGTVPRYTPPSSAGNIRVNYAVQESPSTTANGQLSDVQAIEFYPGYVVVRQKNGGGQVFFSEHTRYLSWSDYGAAK